MEPGDIALTALRVWLGVVMLAHGVNHGRSLEGTARWFEKKGFRQARHNARLSSFGEVGIGLALVSGLLTPLAAAGLVATMAVAFWSIHRFAGFFVFARPDEGWEYVATLTVAGLALAALGPGPYSLDALFGLDGTLSGWPGIFIALGGLALAAVQLTVFWRRPT